MSCLEGRGRGKDGDLVSITPNINHLVLTRRYSPLGIDTEVKRVIRGAALLGMDYENRPVISFPKDFEAGNLAQDAKLIGFTTEGGPIIRFSKHYESISRCITRRQDSEETVLQLSSTPRSDPPQQESNPLDSSQENSNTGSR